jgi:hypothetical protein
MDQQQEMIRYALSFGKEVLESIRSNSQYSFSQRLEDINWLEREMREADDLLKRLGEFDEQTILQMRIVVKLNGILSRRYKV